MRGRPSVRGRWLRALLLGIVTFALVLTVGAKLRRGTVEGASISEGANSIEQAVQLASGTETVVTGFVFVIPGSGVVLCPARTRGDRPECRGSAVVLEDLDLSRLDLERITLEDGRDYGWSADEVTVAGTWFGGLLRVTDLLR